MKLGIIVVYLFDQDTEPLFDLHIAYIRKFTVSSFVIYASVERLDQKWRLKLSLFPEIQQCEIVPTSLRGGAEHAYYLDQLTKIAFERGSTHVVTLHLDSFPVSRGWDQTLETITRQTGTCAAAEAAYTACLFFSKEFYVRFQPTFAFSDQSPGYLEFVKNYKLINHSGTHFLYTCFENKLEWHILKKGLHPSIPRFAQLLGNVIFHLGAGVRLSINECRNEGKSLSRVQALLLFAVQFFRKVSWMRKLWVLICKCVPKKRAQILKEWLFDHALLADAVGKEVSRNGLIRQSKSYPFEVKASEGMLKQAIRQVQIN